MRIYILGLGVIIGIVMFIYEADSRYTEIPLGLYLLPVALILASAFWRDATEKSAYYKTYQRIYASLAEGPLTMDELITALAKVSLHQDREWFRQVIGIMLEEKQLVVKDGRVQIPEVD
ncbi:hypothetical protein SAMN02745181_0575 [Rubritalea squalenifaciens DSM 18772]|uniref:Uncharacterized protein n=1 Tax=Rubritalea squalenifaciens DSM 18772 TaxID=1123071 RepID=A0A1M6CV84_9BACT|nr:hypothetical protein [Rubritalea squalenifaciens]SHI64869.1 hypothetical protein SAMN02745181_0575 [Rubritalea squalenifaciens DSM 18772]